MRVQQLDLVGSIKLILRKLAADDYAALESVLAFVVVHLVHDVEWTISQPIQNPRLVSAQLGDDMRERWMDAGVLVFVDRPCQNLFVHAPECTALVEV